MHIKQLKLIIPALLLWSGLRCQGLEEEIRRGAIDCSGLPVPNEALYRQLAPYKCICIGEMHGTKEPAEFAVCVTKLLTAHHKKVLLGIEIDAESMRAFAQQPDSAGLRRSKFFLAPPGDGRASAAWLKALSDCQRLGARLCFFDGDPDSVKYSNLMACYRADTNCVIVTLSGNVHSKLLPYKNERTMGCYVKDFFGSRVLSVNHAYNQGTMYNRTAQGLSLRTIEPSNSIFAAATDLQAYFVLNTFNPGNGYSAYYCTRTVNASLPPAQQTVPSFIDSLFLGIPVSQNVRSTVALLKADTRFKELKVDTVMDFSAHPTWAPSVWCVVQARLPIATRPAGLSYSKGGIRMLVDGKPAEGCLPWSSQLDLVYGSRRKTEKAFRGICDQLKQKLKPLDEVGVRNQEGKRYGCELQLGNSRYCGLVHISMDTDRRVVSISYY